MIAAFDMDRAVSKLIALAANKRANRSIPTGDCVQHIGALVLSSITDIPEPSPEWVAADRALKAFADELNGIGGLELMVDVYDEAAERHGYRAVMGVSASWDCKHGWWH